MQDQKPPRLASGERETVMALLQFQRESLVRKVEGVEDEAARRKLVGSDTTLLWLVKHLAGAELAWIQRRFAGQALELPSPEIGPSDTVASVVRMYHATWGRVENIVRQSALDDLCREVGSTDVNLRWVLMHLLEETARHAGHADILRELIDGETGR